MRAILKKLFTNIYSETQQKYSLELIKIQAEDNAIEGEQG